MAIAFCRTIILYLLIMVGIRLMGKRQVAELEPSELVLTLLISDLAAVPMQDFGIPLLNGVVPIVTLLAITMILSVLILKNIKFRALVCGRPNIVVRSGQIQRREMAKSRYTIDELVEALRLQGISDLSTVQYAILESNGRLSALLYPDHKPVTAQQLNLQPQGGGLPVILINDGRLLRDNLIQRNLDEAWLNQQLKDRGLSSARQVFFLSVDEQDRVYYMAKGDSA